MRPFAIAVGAAAVLLGGCARGSDESEIKQVTGRFATAVEQKDGQVACSQLTADTREELESSEGEPCEKAILSLEVRGSPVSRVRVDVTSASARLARGGTVFLDDTPAGWRISAAGCKPVPGRPYDCDVES